MAHLESWGLRVVLGDHVRGQHPRLDYLAAEDRDRAADLQRTWCDPDISAVLCARGGYGSIRTLEHVDWPAMAAAEPKIFAGSSDLTAVHGVFGSRLEVATVFGPMIATEAFTTDTDAREHLRRTLFEPEAVTTLTSPAATALVGGRAQGVTYGGNLSVLAGMLGTPDAPAAPERGIALLEDVTEKPYRLDFYLTQLLRAGWFDDATGVALGSWRECGSLEEVRAVMGDRLGQLGIPVVWELGFGHCAGQHTVPLGVAAELDADAHRLTLRRPAVA